MAEVAYRQVQERLAGTPNPKLASLMANLTSTHDTLAPLRAKSDSAVHQPKPAREASVLSEYGEASQAYLDAILNLTAELEAALKLSDPLRKTIGMGGSQCRRVDLAPRRARRCRQ
jgi:hypothetical protein